MDSCVDENKRKAEYMKQTNDELRELSIAQLENALQDNSSTAHTRQLRVNDAGISEPETKRRRTGSISAIRQEAPEVGTPYTTAALLTASFAPLENTSRSYPAFEPGVAGHFSAQDPLVARVNQVMNVIPLPTHSSAWGPDANNFQLDPFYD